MKLVIFTTCKPFVGDDAWRQEQAIKSWTLLTGIEKKIIIIGNDEGTKEICEKYNLIHEPNVKNLMGVPYLHEMLEIGSKYANKDDYLFWTNSDMIYFNELIENIYSFDEIRKKKKINNFALIGRRHDWFNPSILNNFSKEYFIKNINLNPKTTIRITKTDSTNYEIAKHQATGIDYVIHSPTTFINRVNKNLVIAGTMHDMILVGTSLNNKFFTCNISDTNLCIHQNHSNIESHNNGPKSHILINNNRKFGNYSNMKKISDSQFKTLRINGKIHFNNIK